ncbi:hypothetical protein [Jiella pelagia]|uniref:Uncharacterized protein n=1 Tax=Jiella pelagia TaxID=2986949 RepID=A0ABY7C3C7_9HYPH|nr:hypothetical protein [Jiella pelagia]WAP69544.1 hypothetical protein OH818_04655 [Jiella pelagia]
MAFISVTSSSSAVAGRSSKLTWTISTAAVVAPSLEVQVGGHASVAKLQRQDDDRNLAPLQPYFAAIGKAQYAGLQVEPPRMM